MNEIILNIDWEEAYLEVKKVNKIYCFFLFNS